MTSTEILRELAKLPEEKLLATMAHLEARGEKSVVGRLAVMHVALNRRDAGYYGQGLKGVILRPKAFSCFNVKDPNLSLALTTHKLPGYSVTLAIAELVLGGWTFDPTKNAMLYFNPKIVPDGFPSTWNRKKVVYCCDIGRHQFYREIR